MKKLTLLAMLILASVMMVGQTAFAFSLGNYTGPVEFKFYDWTIGRTYSYNAGTWDVVNRTGTGLSDSNLDLVNGTVTTPDGIADSWGILQLTSINDPDGNSLWSNSGSEKINGVIWGFDDSYINALGPGSIEVVQKGGYLALYLGNSALTPSAALPGDIAVANGLTGADPRLGQNPLSSDPWNATNGTLFLLLEAAPGVVPSIDPLATRDETVNGLTSPFSGTGSGYFNIIGGSAAGLFDSNLYEGGSDTYASFSFVGSGNYGFDAKSSDPAKFTTVPEPTTMLLFGLGLTGLATVRRKKAA